MARETIRDEKGIVIGWSEPYPDGRTALRDGTGKLLGTEDKHGTTRTSTGQVAAKGDGSLSSLLRK